MEKTEIRQKLDKALGMPFFMKVIMAKSKFLNFPNS